MNDEILARLKKLAEHKAKIRAERGILPSTTLAASLAGLGMVAEVVSDNDATPTMKDADFQTLCRGSTAAVAELAILLQYWNVDLGLVLGMFLDAVDEAAPTEKPKGRSLLLVTMPTVDREIPS